MSSIDADPSAVVELPSRGETTPRLPNAIRIYTLVLIVGLIAGFASWILGESVVGRFRPSLQASSGIIWLRESNEAKFGAGGVLDATFAFGMLGAFLGWGLGAAGGLARGSTRSALIAAAFGAISGTIAGAVASQVLVPVYFRLFKPNGDDLVLGFLFQSGIGTAVGVVGGAAFGLGLGGRTQAVPAISGGVLGAVTGVLVYQLIGALAFPLDGTTRVLSDTPSTRLLARLTLTMLVSLGAAMSVIRSHRDESEVKTEAADAGQTRARPI